MSRNFLTGNYFHHFHLKRFSRERPDQRRRPAQAGKSNQAICTQKSNIEIVRIFRDVGISGTIADRPDLGKMIVSLALNGKDIETVTVEKLDRLERDIMIQRAIIRD